MYFSQQKGEASLSERLPCRAKLRTLLSSDFLTASFLRCPAHAKSGPGWQWRGCCHSQDCSWGLAQPIKGTEVMRNKATGQRPSVKDSWWLFLPPTFWPLPCPFPCLLRSPQQAQQAQFCLWTLNPTERQFIRNMRCFVRSSLGKADAG